LTDYSVNPFALGQIVALGCVEVMGRSIVERIADHLLVGGVEHLTVVATNFSSEVIAGLVQRGAEVMVAEGDEEVRRHVIRKMSEYRENGIRIVVVLKLDSYVEFDLDDLLQFHEEHCHSVTRAFDRHDAINLWVMDTDAADHHDPKTWPLLEGGRYARCRYTNRLRHVRDLRKLVVDSFAGRCSIRPCGTEVRPGVWVDDNATVHRRARVVAPAYIGKRTKVQATALITRSSSLERDCEIGSGTVVEDACVLPNTYVGRWLDVSHAVVDGGTLSDLRANITVEIVDGALMARAACANRRGWFSGSEHANVVKRLSGFVKKTLSS
jgi:NDP-sugar pyrophosphorylase family protein